MRSTKIILKCKKDSATLSFIYTPDIMCAFTFLEETPPFWCSGIFNVENIMYKHCTKLELSQEQQNQFVGYLFENKIVEALNLLEAQRDSANPYSINKKAIEFLKQYLACPRRSYALENYIPYYSPPTLPIRHRNTS